MRYAYRDLGYQVQGTAAVVRWRGAGADVMLLDPVNFAKYRDGTGTVFRGDGGHYRRAPAEMTIPDDGRWYVVADLGGHGGLAGPTVEVHPPRQSDEPAEEHRLSEVA